jgi:hypothetical protein
MKIEEQFVERLRSLFRYEPDTGNIYWVAAGKGRIKKKPAGTRLHSGYIGILVDGQRIMAHRIAWALRFGFFPTDQIDHVNGDKADNRLTNLREATNSQNGKNQKRKVSNRSGIAGVSFDAANNKWRACIKVDGRQINLGRFRSIDDAAEVRRKAEMQYFGEWRRAA